jgi:hypothetical protein
MKLQILFPAADIQPPLSPQTLPPPRDGGNIQGGFRALTRPDIRRHQHAQRLAATMLFTWGRSGRWSLRWPNGNNPSSVTLQYPLARVLSRRTQTGCRSDTRRACGFRAPSQAIGIKLSIDSFRTRHGLVLWPELLGQDVRGCPAFAHGLGRHTWGGGPELAPAATQDEFGLTAGLPPGRCTGLDMPHQV